MKEEDVIIVNDIPAEDYERVIDSAVKYSVLSLPFTINRMKITDPGKRALNIAKGKIAEGLFKLFCKNEKVNVDFKSCETPFWQTDKRDFLFNGYEWDIKNNFIYIERDIFERNIFLPALIPNRHKNDQWNTRNDIKTAGSKGVKYLFTFMKGAGLRDGRRGEYFMSLRLSERQDRIIRKLYRKYKGNPTQRKPFSESDFWSCFLKDNKKLYEVNFFPALVITGYADDASWSLFKDTGPDWTYYVDYVKPYWYKKQGRKNSLNWLNGTLWTKITNRTAPVEYLKPFKELIRTVNQPAS